MSADLFAAAETKAITLFVSALKALVIICIERVVATVGHFQPFLGCRLNKISSLLKHKTPSYSPKKATYVSFIWGNAG